MKTAYEIANEAKNAATISNRRAALADLLCAISEEQIAINTQRAAEELVNQLDVRANLGYEIFASAAFSGEVLHGICFPIFLYYGQPIRNTIAGNVDFNHPVMMKQLLELLTNAGYNYEITHRNENSKEGNRITLVNTLKVFLPSGGRN